MSDERIGLVVGRISPGPEGEPPTFEIIPSEHYKRREVETCEHRKFKLDTRWNVVTCGECGEHVDAFAALLRYAEWGEYLKRRKEEAERAWKRLWEGELKRLKRLRTVTDAEKEKIEAALRRPWKADVEADARELRKLANEIDRARKQRLYEKRKKRRNT